MNKENIKKKENKNTSSGSSKVFQFKLKEIPRASREFNLSFDPEVITLKEVYETILKKDVILEMCTQKPIKEKIDICKFVPISEWHRISQIFFECDIDIDTPNSMTFSKFYENILNKPKEPIQVFIDFNEIGEVFQKQNSVMKYNKLFYEQRKTYEEKLENQKEDYINIHNEMVKNKNKTIENWKKRSKSLQIDINKFKKEKSKIEKDKKANEKLRKEKNINDKMLKQERKKVKNFKKEISSLNKKFLIFKEFEKQNIEFKKEIENFKENELNFKKQIKNFDKNEKKMKKEIEDLKLQNKNLKLSNEKKKIKILEFEKNQFKFEQTNEQIEDNDDNDHILQNLELEKKYEGLLKKKDEIINALLNEMASLKIEIEMLTNKINNDPNKFQHSFF